MTLCVISGKHCVCQPQEGVFCPDAKTDAERCKVALSYAIGRAWTDPPADHYADADRLLAKGRHKPMADPPAAPAACIGYANDCACPACQRREAAELCEQAAALLESLAAENARLRETLSFFASVIKCGEPWTERCQQAFDAARKP